MKIYPKLLTMTLPFIVVGSLIAGGMTSLLAEKALSVLAERWLSTKLMEAEGIAWRNFEVLRKYGLEGAAANVKKAQADTLDALAAIEIGTTGRVLIMDAEGNLLLSFGGQGQGGNVGLEKGWREVLADDGGRVVLARDQERMLAVWRLFGPWNWRILACASEQELYGEVYGVKKYILLVSVIVSVASALFIMFLARRFAAPVHTLVEEARKIGQGDLETPVSVRSNDEIGLLGEAIQEMKERLRDNHSRLEQRIEERRRAEKELASLNLHLESLVLERTSSLAAKARELEEANVRLQELDGIKSSFLSSVSHELRTPLTSVRGFAKLIARDFRRFFRPLGKQDAEAHEIGDRICANLDIITNEGERLTRLINDVLDLNKIESGGMEWSDRELDMNEVVERAARAVEGQLAQSPKTSLLLDLPSGLPRIVADMDRMTQVVVNLLSNAIKFTPEGQVIVTAKTVHGRLQVSVRDTGRGIPESDLPKIFDKFFQVRDTLSDKPKGTGLGLAICREIVESYKGRIWVESRKSGGSTFTFELPLP